MEAMNSPSVGDLLHKKRRKGKKKKKCPKGIVKSGPRKGLCKKRRTHRRRQARNAT